MPWVDGSVWREVREVDREVVVKQAVDFGGWPALDVPHVVEVRGQVKRKEADGEDGKHEGRGEHAPDGGLADGPPYPSHVPAQPFLEERPRVFTLD